MSLLFLQRDGLAGAQKWAPLPEPPPAPEPPYAVVIHAISVDFTKSGLVEIPNTSKILFITDVFVACLEAEKFVAGPSINVVNEDGLAMSPTLPASSALASPNTFVPIARGLASSILAFAGAKQPSVQVISASSAVKHSGVVVVHGFEV